MTDDPAGDSLRVEVLGPLRAWVDGRQIALGPPQQRAVLGVLASNAGRTVSRGELIDALWAHTPPANAAGSVHIYVSRLRRGLEPDRASRGPGTVLVTDPAGYQLRLAEDGLDARRLARTIEDAHRSRHGGELAKSIGLFDAALALCQGTPFAGVPGPYADCERTRLCELQQQAVEERAEIMLLLGRHVQVVPELAGLVERFPLRERLRYVLMLALYRCGRQAEALAEYQAIRRRLIEELGIEPGPDLQCLFQQILSNDEALRTPVQAAEPKAVALSPVAAPQAGPARLAAEAGDGGAADGEGLAVPGRPDGLGVVLAPAQLPRVTDKFTARQAELKRLGDLLPGAGGSRDDSVPIAAIDGPAGSGKTTLALHFARRVGDRFPDGQLYVNLRGFGPEPPRAPEQVLGQLLRGLGVAGQALPTDPDELAALLRSRIAGRRILLILDNASDSRQVLPLLPGNGCSLVLVTSRNRLGGLATQHGAERITLDPLSPAESFALLSTVLGPERVAAEPEATAELAGLCAYLPLALRIAADRLAVSPYRTVAGLTRELAADNERLDVLALCGEPEPTDVRAVFTWSYRSLRPPVSRAFRLLSLHPGPDFSRLAAAALLGLEPSAARAVLEALTGVHLLQETGPDRYRLHDLLRLYARECAQAEETAADRAAAVRRILQWYLHTAENAARALIPYRNRPRLDAALCDGITPVAMPSGLHALDWCDSEYANLVSAVEEAARLGEHAVAWQLPVVLWSYFLLRKPWAREWIGIHGAGLRAAEAVGDRRGQAWVLSSLGYTCQALRRFDEGLSACRRAQDLWREIGDEEGQAVGLIGLGLNYRGLGRFDEANDCVRQAADLWRAIGDATGLGFALGHLGAGYQGLGRFDEAVECLDRALETFRSVPNQWGEVTALTGLGQTYRRLHRFDQALHHLLRALDLHRAIHDRHGEGRTQYLLGKVLLEANRPAEAERHLREALSVFEEVRDPHAAEVLSDHLAALRPAESPPTR